MFGIPGEVFWPTAAFGSIILLVFGAVVLLRYLPQPKSRSVNQPDHDALEDLQARLGQLEHFPEPGCPVGRAGRLYGTAPSEPTRGATVGTTTGLVCTLSVVSRLAA